MKTLEALAKDFDYRVNRAFNSELLEGAESPRKKPLLAHAYSFEGGESFTAMLKGAIETYSKLTVIVFGFDPAGLSQAIDGLKKASYPGFKQGDMKPA